MKDARNLKWQGVLTGTLCLLLLVNIVQTNRFAFWSSARAQPIDERFTSPKGGFSPSQGYSAAPDPRTGSLTQDLAVAAATSEVAAANREIAAAIRELAAAVIQVRDVLSDRERPAGQTVVGPRAPAVDVQVGPTVR